MSIKEPNSGGPVTHGGSNSDLNKEFGNHFIVELINCLPDRLKKVKDVKQIMMQVIQKSKTTLVDASYHQFQPEGVTGMILIRESHIAIHTWPLRNEFHLDIYSCRHYDARVVYELLHSCLELEKFKLTDCTHGCDWDAT